MGFISTVITGAFSFHFCPSSNLHLGDYTAKHYSTLWLVMHPATTYGQATWALGALNIRKQRWQFGRRLQKSSDLFTFGKSRWGTATTLDSTLYPLVTAATSERKWRCHIPHLRSLLQPGPALSRLLFLCLNLSWLHRDCLSWAWTPESESPKPPKPADPKAEHMFSKHEHFDCKTAFLQKWKLHNDLRMFSQHRVILYESNLSGERNCH